MSSELANCPFCGGPGRISYSDRSETFSVRCNNWTGNAGSTSCMGSGAYANSEAEAIAAWNRRPSTQDREAVIEEIDAERKRQVSAEDWSPEHDDQHQDNQLAHAAACYAAPELMFPLSRVPHHWTDAARYMDAQSEPVGEVEVPSGWPWDGQWWKPGDRRRNLVKAAALIVAEIERLDRRSLTPESGNE